MVEPQVRAPPQTWLWVSAVFGAIFGTMNWYIGGAGLHCGNGSHMGAGLFHASWSIVPDWKYTNYVIQFGSNKGTGSGHSFGFNARLAAEARAKGSYLVGPDMRYVRGKGTGKPMLWDDPSVIDSTDVALFGNYDVNGAKCQPAFQLIKEHVKQYTPEKASEVSTVPAATIRRLANEFAESFADIVLPDTHALESWGLFEHHAPFFTWPIGLEGWYFPIRQPVVEPQYERRQVIEILWDLADRIDMREEINHYYNVYFSSFGGGIDKW